MNPVLDSMRRGRQLSAELSNARVKRCAAELTQMLESFDREVKAAADDMLPQNSRKFLK